MKVFNYRIAGHLVRIQFVDECNDETLIQSFAPFQVDSFHEEEEPLTVVTVDDSFSFSCHGDEIGQFDSGGNNHGVYQTEDGGYQFEVSAAQGVLCSLMQTSADFGQCVVSLRTDNKHLRAFGLNNCLMMAYAFSSADKETVLLHASVIRKDGKGYLMTAPSGTGKSTHTWLWYKNIPDCDLMNDDNPVVRIVNNEAVVFGTPWSGKTPCYRNIQAPVGAIVRIQQRPQNEIRKLSPVQSLAVLLPASSSMKWDKRIYHGICDTLSAIISKVGVYELGCLPNAEAAILCYNTVR